MADRWFLSCHRYSGFLSAHPPSTSDDDESGIYDLNFPRITLTNLAIIENKGPKDLFIQLGPTFIPLENPLVTHVTTWACDVISSWHMAPLPPNTWLSYFPQKLTYKCQITMSRGTFYAWHVAPFPPNTWILYFPQKLTYKCQITMSSDTFYARHVAPSMSSSWAV